MKANLLPIFEQLQSERNIERSVVIEAIKSAVESASRKSLPHCGTLCVEIDEDSWTIQVFEQKEVAEEVEDSTSQISFDEARRIDPDIKVGDTLKIERTPQQFGRIAAQTARQVIIQKIKEAERNSIFKEYKKREGEIVSGVVKKYVRGNIIVDLGRTEAIIPYKEQSPRESYRQGNRIKAYILHVEETVKGPQIVLSRSDPALVKMLFEVEVPEIYDGTVELRAVAREAGYRTKVAVESHDASIDAVGACVGMRGVRVRAIVEELAGEKIDVVKWSDDPATFAKNALGPAEISHIEEDRENLTLRVSVPDDNLSLAIGKGGQNARLAAKLTGWKVDICSESEARKRLEDATSGTALLGIQGIGPKMAQNLASAGFGTVEKVAGASVEELCGVPGVGQKTAQKIIEAVKDES